MSAKKLKTSLFSFRAFSQPDTSAEQPKKTPLAPPQTSPRYIAFFGAVFNSLTSIFFENYAERQNLELYSAKQIIIDERFAFTIIAKDDLNHPQSTAAKTAQSFFQKLISMSRHNEFEHVLYGEKYDPDKKEHAYTIIFESPLELIELVEQLLKPYDIGTHTSPSVRFSRAKENTTHSFALFPQYSIEHIRALLHHAQGRNPEGYGPQLSH